MLQKPATVVFDLDGTLADTSGDLLAAANACFLSMGFGAPLTDSDQLTAFGGGRAMLRLGFERIGDPQPEPKIEALYPQLLTHYQNAIAVHTRLYPGALEAVHRLKDAGYAVVICTNKPAALAERLLTELGVRGLFDALVGADTLPVRKPDPAPYLLAVERAGGDPRRSVMIGDTDTDLKTARAVGVAVILVGFGPEGAGISRLQPDYMLDDYTALSGLVAQALSET